MSSFESRESPGIHGFMDISGTAVSFLVKVGDRDRFGSLLTSPSSSSSSKCAASFIMLALVSGGDGGSSMYFFSSFGDLSDRRSFIGFAVMTMEEPGLLIA
jgi:hypothetical protein